MRSFLAVLLFLSGAVALHAQTTPYKVVFDLTSKDSLDQKAVVRWIKEITGPNPNAKLEIVMYGKGYELVMPEKSAYLPEIREAMKNENVSFAVCQIAMKNNHIEKDQLLPGVRTVPDGIYEIISKQHDQWGYIKVAH